VTRFTPEEKNVRVFRHSRRHPSGSVCSLLRAGISHVVVKRRLLGPRALA
jgi:hypothetical protein